MYTKLLFTIITIAAAVVVKIVGATISKGLRARPSQRIKRRTVAYISSAFAIELVGLGAVAAMIPLGTPFIWVSLTLVALPGVVYTVFVPALRDLSPRTRACAFVLLTAGMALGLLVLSNLAVREEDYLPTIAVGLASLIITAFIAFIDGRPAPKADADALDAADEGRGQRS